MPQSLAHIQIHLVFSTKHRERRITDDVRDSLHAYLATVLDNLDCPALIINSADDHVHILFSLARTKAISEVVEALKTSSSKWLKTQSGTHVGFAWQAGYGAFSVSESQISVVRDYIVGQQEHHRTVTFQDEYRSFLDRHRVAYDERYVWD